MLKRVIEDVWVIEREIRMGPGVYLPVRCTLIRLPDGAIWIHSPVAIDDELAATIDELGPVKHVVAPNNFHHLFLKKAMARWPDASMYYAPGLPAKRQDIDFSKGELLSDASAWGGVLASIHIEGVPAIGETVFYHTPSKSLVVTDLVFNLSSTRGAMAPLIFRAMGFGKGRFVQGRFFGMARKDKAATRKCLKRVLALDLDRVIMAHGDIATDALPHSLEHAMARGLR